MSEEQTMTVQERRRIVRLLERIHSLAEESSRRGRMQDGQAYLTQQYHAIVATLAARGHRLPDYFPPIGDEASLGMVGFASAQVAEYLIEEIEAEEAARGEGAASESGESFFDQFFSGGEFQHIGEAMREAMPDWLRAARKGRRNANPATGQTRSSSAAEAHSAHGASAEDLDMEANVDVRVDVQVDPNLDSLMSGLSDRVQEIAGRMRQPGVPPEELQRLATELAHLGEQQARLAREAAARRSS